MLFVCRGRMFCQFFVHFNLINFIDFLRLNAVCAFIFSLVTLLPEFDKEPLKDDAEGRLPPVTLMSMLDHCGAELLSLMGGARIGIDKPLHLTPNSDELCCVRAFLLTWKLLLKYLQYTTTEVFVLFSL